MLDATVLEPDRSITDNPQTPGDTFGDFVATYGNLIAVGLPNAAGDGLVKVFDATTGSVIATIANPDPDDDGSGFGAAMTFIDATHLAVTDFGGFIGDEEVPTVRIFTLNGGMPSYVTITAPGDTDFGNTLAAVGGDLLVAAPSAFGGAGAVYRYNADGTPISDPDALGNPTNVYTVDNTTGLGLVMAADPYGSTMLFSSGFAETRRVYEISFDGNVVAEYDEADDANAFGSFAIGFNDSSVFVGDPNVGRVTQFARTTGGASGAIVGEIIDATEFAGFGSSIAVNGQHVVIAAQGSGVMTVYDDNFGDGDNAPLATTQGGQSFAFLGAIRNLSGQEIMAADAFADGGAGRLYVFDLADLGGEEPPAGTVTAVLDNDGNLLVTGTGGADNILVKSNGSGGLIVLVDGVQLGGTFAVTGTVRINGGGGDDTLTSDSSNTFPSEIRGGDGNDTITGGGGNDLLFGDAGADKLYARQGDDVALGGDGDDSLYGGQGRDILIGGNGADRIEGEQGDDILIAGYTQHDNDVNALASIRAAWLAESDYATRVAALSADLLSVSRVTDDDQNDVLLGGKGQDWFLVGNGDFIIDAKTGETATAVD